MSRRSRPAESESYRAGKRGRHKRAGSPEAQRWNADHAPAPRPSWLDAGTYRELVELAQRIELGR